MKPHMYAIGDKFIVNKWNGMAGSLGEVVELLPSGGYMLKFKDGQKHRWAEVSLSKQEYLHRYIPKTVMLDEDLFTI